MLSKRTQRISNKRGSYCLKIHNCLNIGEVFNIKHRETDEINQNAVRILESYQLLHVYEKLKGRGRRFLNKAIRINQTGKPFTVHDFNELDRQYYKNLVFALKKLGFIEVVSKTVFTNYKVRGFQLKGCWEKIAADPTEVSISKENVFKILQENLADLDKPALHNIRLHFHVDYIHHSIQSQYNEGSNSIQFSLKNNSFIIKPDFSWGKYCTAQLLITPKDLVQVIIKNTFQPLAIDEDGIFELCSKLGEIRRYLIRYSQEIPPVSSWIFVRADFGRDSKRPIHKIFPAVEFRDFSGALVRIYAKKFPDNKRRLRIEKNINPNRKMQEISERILSVENILSIEL